MSKINALLTSRLKQKTTKMTALAELSSTGTLSSFAGVFKIEPLSSQEHAVLAELLQTYQIAGSIEADLQKLVSVTSEVRAIHNQAAILHGERIQRAQEIFKKYREGAFSAWLLATYGNRQTPYNFLQYYEFHCRLPLPFHGKLQRMPRQAVYTLASREAPFEEKLEIVKNYEGETKQQLLLLIRKRFPLSLTDARREDLSSSAITLLQKLHALFQEERFRPSKVEQKTITELLRACCKKFL